jgi:hypothetical protein
MNDRKSSLGVIVVMITLGTTIIGVGVTPILIEQSAYAAKAEHQECVVQCSNAPIATSGDNNVYITWWSNKTGNNEVMFKASTDGGKTFGSKMNLSSTPKSDSRDVQINAAGNNVYVSWWERNQTSKEPIMRVSNDNGKTFGEKIMLSEK